MGPSTYSRRRSRGQVKRNSQTKKPPNRRLSLFRIFYRPFLSNLETILLAFASALSVTLVASAAVRHKPSRHIVTSFSRPSSSFARVRPEMRSAYSSFVPRNADFREAPHEHFVLRVITGPPHSRQNAPGITDMYHLYSFGNCVSEPSSRDCPMRPV